MALETATTIKELVATNPVSGDPKSEGDNHIRMLKTILQSSFPNLSGQILRYVDKSTNYTVLVTDITVLFNCTAGLTLALTAAATLGQSFMFSVYANGGDVVIDPNGTELINGAETLTVKNGAHVQVYCTGSAFFAITLKEASIEAVKVDGLYLSLSSTNPGTSLGYGTWEAYGTGRALVAIDPSNSIMDTVGETFGSADSVAVTHSHSVTDPGHSHATSLARRWGSGNGGGQGWCNDGQSSGSASESTTSKTTGISIASAGESGANKNYQPSIAIYVWRRTA